MIEKTITFYQCKHCGKADTKEELMQLHEDTCLLNPSLQGCYTCGNGYLAHNRHGDTRVRCCFNMDLAGDGSPKVVKECSNYGYFENEIIQKLFQFNNSQSLCCYL